MRQHLTTVTYRHCEWRTEAALKYGYNYKRSVYRNFRLCMKRVDNRCKWLIRDFNAAAEVVRLLTTILDGQRRRAY